LLLLFLFFPGKTGNSGLPGNSGLAVLTGILEADINICSNLYRLAMLLISSACAHEVERVILAVCEVPAPDGYAKFL
jgi:hypothetical protein